MDKIEGFVSIPVMKLTEIVAECGKVAGMAADLFAEYSVNVPEKEASSDPKAEASAEPKQEASSEEALNGLVVHNYAQKKPFEMVIE